MRFLVHVGRVLNDVVRYSIASRQFGLLLILLLGLLLAAVVTTAQVAAPFVIYPFV